MCSDLPERRKSMERFLGLPQVAFTLLHWITSSRSQQQHWKMSLMSLISQQDSQQGHPIFFLFFSFPAKPVIVLSTEQGVIMLSIGIQDLHRAGTSQVTPITAQQTTHPPQHSPPQKTISVPSGSPHFENYTKDGICFKVEWPIAQEWLLEKLLLFLWTAVHPWKSQDLQYKFISPRFLVSGIITPHLDINGNRTHFKLRQIAVL